MMRLVAVAVASLMVFGCAYPRRSTPLTPAQSADAALSAPADVWRLTIVEAVVPPRQRSGLGWDGEDEEDGPDPRVRFRRGDETVWESEAVPDSLHPRFDVTLPENVWLPRDRTLRLEVWDDDEVGGDPVGVWQGSGLPDTALPGAEARLMLEGRATLVVRIDPPLAKRGTGIALYEVRGDELRVLELIERSPAGRAGVQVGDRIIAVDGKKVSELTDAQAASQLSLIGMRRGATMTVMREGTQRRLTLDGGPVWPVM